MAITESAEIEELKTNKELEEALKEKDNQIRLLEDKNKILLEALNKSNDLLNNCRPMIQNLVKDLDNLHYNVKTIDIVLNK